MLVRNQMLRIAGLIWILSKRIKCYYSEGATTFSITTFNITTFSIRTFTITTFIITTFSIRA